MSITRTSPATDRRIGPPRAAAFAFIAALLVAFAATGCGGEPPPADPPSPVCEAGTETCSCAASSSCNAGLSCENGACVVCPASQVDCPCVAGACEGTLVCDTGSKKCRSPEACACAPKQICERLDGKDATCKPACEPGYDWNGTTGKCDPKQVGTTCGQSGDGAIGAQCTELHKECRVILSRAECGGCLLGYKAQGSLCVAVKRCSELTCAAQKRACIEATSSEDARCGDCNSGYVLAGTTCVEAASCSACDSQNRTCVGAGSCGDCKVGYTLAGGQCVASLTCTGTQRPSCGDRVCVEGTPARCGDACTDPTKRWNGTTCDTRITCSTLSCTTNQVCVEGRDGATAGDGGVATNAVDATCASQCPAGQGVIGGRCVQCASSVSCDTTQNFTGTVVAEASSAGAACFCEPATGYFFSNTGATANRAVPCDADGDGFTNDRVHGLLSSTDPSTRRKANCSPRVVDRAEFVFASGLSTQYAIGDTAPMSQSATGATELPLYESARNDGEGTQTLRATRYGNEDVATINSLTKACALRPGTSGLPEDLDDNGAADVSQGATGDFQGATFVVRASPLPTGLSRSASPALVALYAKYALYAHYRELYRVTVEPNTNNASTFKIVVRERAIAAGAADRIAFPEIACRRADDPHVINAPYDGASSAWNRGLTGDRTDISSTGATADFAWVGRGVGTFDSPSTPRFRHHATWKCVTLVDDAAALQETAMLAEHYERVARADSNVAEPRFSRWVHDGATATDFPALKRRVDYSFAELSSPDERYRPEFYQPSAAGGFYASTSIARGLVAVGDVVWMAQPYLPHRAYQRGSGADPRGPWVTDYELGCINECAFDGPARCAQAKAQLTVTTAPVGSIAIGTDQLSTSYVQYASNSNGTQDLKNGRHSVRSYLGGTPYQYLTTADARFACTNESARGTVWASGSNGRYRCGCSGSTAGASCEVGCATGPGVARELATTGFFSIDTRFGLWMCAAPTLTSEVLVATSSPSYGVAASSGVMSGGGFKLRGGVSDATFGAFGAGPGTPQSTSVTTGTRTLWSR